MTTDAPSLRPARGSLAPAPMAEAVLDELSRVLVTITPDAISEVGLANGKAGLAVTHAVLAARYPERPHAALAEAHLAAAWSGVRATRLEPWLAEGVAGVAWATAFLVGGDAEADDVHAATDALFARVLAERGPLPFELLYGTAGLVPYALERLASAPGRALAASVAARLAAQCVATDDGAALLYDPRWNPREPTRAPFVHFGTAHGTPGALVAMAALAARDVGGVSLRARVRDLARGLLAARRPDDGAGAFRCFSDDDGAATRDAWCYGDPGVAWSLLVAGRAIGDRDIEGAAIAIAERLASRVLTAPSLAACGIADAGLCHGAMGLAHVLARAATLTESATLGAAAARARSDAFERFDRGAPFRFRARGTPDAAPVDAVGFIEGCAGVALALASAIDPEGADGWDRPLLVGP